MEAHAGPPHTALVTSHAGHAVGGSCEPSITRRWSLWGASRRVPTRNLVVEVERKRSLSDVSVVVGSGAAVGYACARMLGVGPLRYGLWQSRLDPWFWALAAFVLGYWSLRARIGGVRIATAAATGVVASILTAAELGIGRLCDFTPPCPAHRICPMILIQGPCHTTPLQWTATFMVGTAVATALIFVGLKRGGEVRRT